MKENVLDLVEHIRKRKELETFNKMDFNHEDLIEKSLTQRRVYSFLVDFSLIGVLSSAIHTSYMVFITEFLFGLTAKAKINLINDTFVLQSIIFILLYTTYFFYSMYVLDGQTFGKKIFKLKTISDQYYFNEDPQSELISIKQSFKRSFGYLACYLSFGTFFIFSMMSEDKRGLPDYISESRTVCTDWLKATQHSRINSSEVISIDINSLEKAA